MYKKLYKRYKELDIPTRRPRVLKLLVVAPMVTYYSHCKHCMMLFDEVDIRVHQKTFQEYPVEWQEDYHRLGKLLEELWRKFPQQLEIELVDPQTPLGLYKSIRHGVTKYPTFILNGKKKVVGWQTEEIISAIESMVGESTSPLLSAQTP